MSSCRLYSPDHKGVVFSNWKVAGSIPWYSKYFAQIRLVFVASERAINKQPVVAKGEASLSLFAISVFKDESKFQNTKFLLGGIQIWIDFMHALIWQKRGLFNLALL